MAFVSRHVALVPLKKKSGLACIASQLQHIAKLLHKKKKKKIYIYIFNHH